MKQTKFKNVALLIIVILISRTSCSSQKGEYCEAFVIFYNSYITPEKVEYRHIIQSSRDFPKQLSFTPEKMISTIIFKAKMPNERKFELLYDAFNEWNLNPEVIPKDYWALIDYLINREPRTINSCDSISDVEFSDLLIVSLMGSEALKVDADKVKVFIDKELNALYVSYADKYGNYFADIKFIVNSQVHSLTVKNASKNELDSEIKLLINYLYHRGEARVGPKISGGSGGFMFENVSMRMPL